MPLARLILAPGPTLPDRAWLQELHDSLRQSAQVMFLARSADELEGIAIPGTHTLFTPRFPTLTDEALDRCDALVTFCSELAERARARGVRTWKLENAHMRQEPAAVSRRILSETTLKPAAKPALDRTTLLEICAVADHRYLPFLIGFVANLDRVGFPRRHLHLLTLDHELDRAVAERFPEIRRVLPKHLWSPEEWRSVCARGNGSKAFASKPRLLRHVLRETGKAVLYSDLDIYYFASPEPLIDEVGNAPGLLFPQWNDQLWHSKFYGVFNAGMVVVRPGAESFLHWWSERCLHDYNGNFLKGYYADQGFLDLAPVYFPELRIYRRGDHNLAYWNIQTLVAGFQPGTDLVPRLRSGLPLQSFHAAVPDRLGIFEWKFGWDQIASFFAGVTGKQAELLEEAVVQQQSEHWLGLSRLRKLEQITHLKLRPWHPKVARRLLHSRWRHVLHNAARIHYRLSALRRRIRPDPDHAATNRSHLQLLLPTGEI